MSGNKVDKTTILGLETDEIDDEDALDIYFKPNDKSFNSTLTGVVNHG